MSAKTWDNQGSVYDLGLLDFGQCGQMASESNGDINPFGKVSESRRAILDQAKCLDTRGAYFEGDQI